MIDWTRSMSQTFEFQLVDPNTWMDKRPLRNVLSCTINRDKTASTLGSASFDTTESVGDEYVRVYLIAEQGKEKHKIPLGTFLVQTPSMKFNGMYENNSLEAYTPLLELKENPPALGYTIFKGENVMDTAYQICRSNMRAPVVRPSCTEVLRDDFIAQSEDTNLSFVGDLIQNADYELGLDEMGRVIFLPYQELETMQPTYTFRDDGKSILYPEINVDRDLYGVPNVVEVLYSTDKEVLFACATNEDPNSITSIQARGRKITHRVTNPSFAGTASQADLDLYAKELLKSLSSVNYTVTYSHAYCGTNIGDCVRLDYRASGIKNVKAKVISQSITCTPGCKVEETAVFTAHLWR